MRLIDADALIESLSINPEDCPGCPEPEWLEELADILALAPTVDAIDRQAAIEAIHGAIFDFFDICDDDEESPMTYKDERLLEINKAISGRIKQLPSAQPGITLESAIDYLHSIGWMQEHDRILSESAQPDRKKGKWNERKVFATKDSDIEEMQSAKCSVCGKYHTTPYLYFFDNFNFCPNCGADMRRDADV